ncbi:MAG TPA: CopG family transcriptional regulator [Burkholderiales bacterium]|nr:CopG family transcriptional regulator [Burkholderiales bacterium]
MDLLRRQNGNGAVLWFSASASTTSLPSGLAVVDGDAALVAVAGPLWPSSSSLICVISSDKMTYMEKTQVYLPKEELDALRKAAARSGRSVADLVRDAIRKVVLKPQVSGPVAIWDGEPKRTSVDHDSVYDEV